MSWEIVCLWKSFSFCLKSLKLAWEFYSLKVKIPRLGGWDTFGASIYQRSARSWAMATRTANYFARYLGRNFYFLGIIFIFFSCFAVYIFFSSDLMPISSQNEKLKVGQLDMLMKLGMRDKA